MRLILIRGTRFVSLVRSSMVSCNNFPISTPCTSFNNTRHWNQSSYATHLCRNALYDIHKNIPGLAYSTYSSSPNEDHKPPTGVKKMSLVQKMKQLAKDYWHIMLPVHVVTSLGWISLFYVAAKNGVDIISIMEKVNFSEQYIDMVRDSGAGNIAVAYALYKVFTPLRYTVTIGGTTMAIRHLSKLGYVKPLSIRREVIEKIQQPTATATTAEHKEKFGKTQFKSQQHTESPKT